MTTRDYIELARQLAVYLAFRRRETDPRAVRDWQGRMLRRLVREACDHVPLYRKKYRAAGVDPDAIRSLDDLGRLPVLTKRELVDAGPDGTVHDARPPDRFLAVKTSGSTGVPLMVFKDRALMARYAFIKVALPVALRLSWRKPRLPRVLGVFAVGPGALERTIMDAEPGAFRLLRKTWSFIDARSGPSEIRAALERVRPDIVMTYPSVLELLTEAALRDGRRPGRAPAAWVLSAEVLTPGLREAAERALGGEIFDLYSSVEATSIALECRRHRGLHVQSNEVVLEILEGGRPVGNGVEGDIVVTDLWNRATPVIRYAGLRDRGALDRSPCVCGNPSPRLLRVGGRRPGLLRLPGGRTAHPYSLTLAMEAVPGIAAYRIVQTARDEVRVWIVPRPPREDGRNPESAMNRAASALGSVLGPGISIRVEAAAEIPGAADPDFTVVRGLDDA